MITKTLVKWFRDARTMPVQLPYRHVTPIIRIRDNALYGDCSVPVLALMSGSPGGCS
jgi:hypothetical protein